LSPSAGAGDENDFDGDDRVTTISSYPLGLDDQFFMTKTACCATVGSRVG